LYKKNGKAKRACAKIWNEKLTRQCCRTHKFAENLNVIEYRKENTMDLTKLHIFSVYATFVFVTLLAILTSNFYLNSVISVIQENRSNFIRISLCIVGIYLFIKFKSLSFWFNVFVFSVWGYGCIQILQLQIQNDGIFYQLNWLILVMFVLIVISFVSLFLGSYKSYYFKPKQ
jgi:hypothetical protein